MAGYVTPPDVTTGCRWRSWTWVNMLEPSFVIVERYLMFSWDVTAGPDDSRVTVASRFPALPPAAPIAAPTIARHTSARRKRVLPMICSPSLSCRSDAQ